MSIADEHPSQPLSRPLGILLMTFAIQRRLELNIRYTDHTNFYASLLMDCSFFMSEFFIWCHLDLHHVFTFDGYACLVTIRLTYYIKSLAVLIFRLSSTSKIQASYIDISMYSALFLSLSLQVYDFVLATIMISCL